MLTPPISN